MRLRKSFSLFAFAAALAWAAAPMKMHTEMTVTALDLAPTFQPDEFTFVPPAGPKEVDSLPGMPNAAGQN